MTPGASLMMASFTVCLLLSCPLQVDSQTESSEPSEAARSFFRDLSCAYYRGDAEKVEKLYDSYPPQALENLKQTFAHARYYQIGVKLAAERVTGDSTVVVYQRFDQFLDLRRDLWSTLLRNIQVFKRTHHLDCEDVLTSAHGNVKAVWALSKGCDARATGGFGEYLGGEYPYNCPVEISLAPPSPFSPLFACDGLAHRAGKQTDAAPPGTSLIACPDIPEGAFTDPSR